MPPSARSAGPSTRSARTPTDFGIEIRVEVHGGVTQELDNFAKILEYADHPNVYACWNSNPTDVKNGSIKDTFALVADRVREVHLRDLTDEAYPWRELFALLKAQNYQGFTLAEIPESRDPDRVLRYFRALWMAYQPSVVMPISIRSCGRCHEAASTSDQRDRQGQDDDHLDQEGATRSGSWPGPRVVIVLAESPRPARAHRRARTSPDRG